MAKGRAPPYGSSGRNFRSGSRWFLMDDFSQVTALPANAAGISRPVCPHVLRHTFSVAALQKGISLAAIQTILGHDHLSTTQIYLNLSPEHVIDEFRAKW